MALDTSSARLFGIDLGKAWSHYRQGCMEALTWPAFAWLEPVQPVRLLREDGHEQWCDARTGLTLPAGAHNDAAQAILLPEDLVLLCPLRLPDLIEDDLVQALHLHAGERSPFPLEQLVLGWRKTPRDDGLVDVVLALASRAHIERHLRERGFELDRPPEVWAPAADAPLILRGFGEDLRERRVRRQRIGVFASLAVLGLVGLTLLLTPFMLKRAQVFDAQAQHAALMAQVAQAVTQREALLHAAARVKALDSLLSAQPDYPRMLEQLTHALPDTAHLTRMDVTGERVRIGGLAENAAALVEQLGAQPGFYNVRTPSAISRSSDGRESFSIEFTLAAPVGASPANAAGETSASEER